MSVRFTALVLAVLLAVGVVAAPLSAAPSGAPTGATTGASLDAGETAVQADGAGAVDPRLENASGPTEVVVRFDPATPNELGPGGTPAADRQRATAALRDHANRSQAPFDRFAAGTAGVANQRDFWLANAKLVELNASRVDVERLAQVRNVVAVHENFEVELLSGTAGSAATASTDATTATSQDHTYGLEMVGAPDVWAQYDQRGQNATVAVLDTGVDVANHSELAPVGWAEFDSGNYVESDPYDDEGHGTHTSGTVVGNVTGSGTHYGVAPEADLLHAKVLDETGSGSFDTIISGMEWAVDHNASPDAMSMSLGAPGYYSQFIEPVQNSHAAGTVVVASIGNDEEGTSSSPGNVYDAISVGAVDSNRNVTRFSGGETIDTSDAWGSDAPSDWPDQYTVPHVSAPGEAVESSVRGGGFGEKRGTSMAAPHVAGVVALARSEYPATDVRDLQSAIEAASEHPDGDVKDTRYGYGIVNASATIREITGSVAGNVTDAAVGESVSNVTVEITDGNGSAVDAAETGADGGFEVVSLEPGSYNLTASHPSFDDATATVEVEPYGTNRTSLTLSPHPGTVAWNVTSAATGTPLENASLTLWNASGGIVNETVANGTSDGSFEPVARDRGYTLSVERADYRRSNRTLDVGPNESVVRNVTLTPEPGTIEGVVTDENGTPVEGALVALADGEAGPVTTDANGSYRLDGVPAEVEQTLNVTARAYHENRSVNRTLAANGSAVANAAIAQRDHYFGVDGFSAPDEVDEGEEFAVEATITNLGAADWNRSVVFEVNGEEAGSTELELNATENATVSFTHAFDTDASNNWPSIEANETSKSRVYVLPSGGGGFFLPPSGSDGSSESEPEGEPDVAVVGAAVRAATVDAGDTVPVDVSVWNTGTADGSIDLTLTADGTAVAEASADVAATERVEKRLSATLDEPGTYDLAVNGEDAGSVVVEAAEPENDTDTDDEPADDGTPGFGPLAALLALLTGGSLVFRRRTDD